jgi:hypothetical protein
MAEEAVKFAEWITSNPDKKGTEQYNRVAEGLKAAVARESTSRVPQQSETNLEMSNVDPSIGDTIDSFFNTMSTHGNALYNLTIAALRPNEAVGVYNDKNELISVRKETDEEKKARVKRFNSEELRDRRFGGNVFKEGSGAAIGAQITAEILDPVNSIFLGPLPKQYFLRLGALALEGASVETLIETGKQLANHGEIIDKDTIKHRQAIGALVPPAFDMVLRGAVKLAAIKDTSLAEHTIQKVEQRYGFHRQQGSNELNSLKKSLRDNKLISSDIETLVERGGRKVALKDSLRPLEGTKLGRFTDKVDDIRGRILNNGIVEATTETTSKALRTLMGAVKDIDPFVAGALQKFEFGLSIGIKRANQRIDNWAHQVSKGTPKFAVEAYKKAALNGDRATLNRLFKEHPKLGKLHDEELRPILDGMFPLLAKSRPSKAAPLEFVEEYFPRTIKDRKGFFNAVGTKTRQEITKALDGEIAAKGAALDPVEEANIINKILSKPDVSTGGTRALSQEKRRVLNKIPGHLLKYYDDPVQAVRKYIHSSSMAIETRKFLGFGRQAGDTLQEANIVDSIGALIKRRADEGALDAPSAERLIDLLSSRFGAGEHAPNAGISNVKNWFYFMTLNDPLNALVQFGDLPISALVNDLRSTIVGLAKAIRVELPGGAKRAAADDDFIVDMVNLGIDRVSVEFESARLSAKAVDLMLRGTGFKMVDRLGKNTNINAALSRFSRLSKSPAGIKKMKNEMEGLFTESQWKQVIDDLSNRRLTDDVQTLAWSKLSEAQPISLSEVPQVYLNHPNGRIFYALKTFMVKQMNLVYERGIKAIREGDIEKGTMFLAKYALFAGMANTGVDQLQSQLTGRAPPDLPEEAYWNMLKNIGVNQFVARKGEREGVGTALMYILAPPITTLDNLTKAGKWLRNVPYGELLYWWTTPEGKDQIEREWSEQN